MCFAQIYFCFPENSQKLYKMPTTTKMTDISAASMNTRTSLMKRAKASSLFFNLYICVRSIGRIFTPKTRILCLILNSRRVFKNQLYFKVKKSNFGAFFQNTFYLCDITPNHLRLRLWLVEMVFFSRYKDQFVAFNYGTKMHALFRENHYLEVSTTANNRIRVFVVEPKIRSKSQCLVILLNKKSIL